MTLRDPRLLLVLVPVIAAAVFVLWRGLRNHPGARFPTLGAFSLAGGSFPVFLRRSLPVWSSPPRKVPGASTAARQAISRPEAVRAPTSLPPSARSSTTMSSRRSRFSCASRAARAARR